MNIFLYDNQKKKKKNNIVPLSKTLRQTNFKSFNKKNTENNNKKKFTKIMLYL